MSSEKFDVIVIGAGLAGLSIAGILASREKKRVLVLEKEKYVGGRLLSFYGRDNKLFNHQGQELDVAGYKQNLASVHSWVHSSSPDMKTIIGQGMLNGFAFEAGGTVGFWGNKSRLAFVMNYLGKPVNQASNQGLMMVGNDGKSKYQLLKGEKYGWMTDEQNKVTKRLLGEMLMADTNKLDEWDNVSLKKWLEDRTSDRTIYEYIAALAAIHMVIGEPENISARDFIRFMHTPAKIGMNLLSGSTGVVENPGFGYIGTRLAEAVTENGGEIRLDTKVDQVVFDGNKVKGVQIGDAVITADQVVCTLPSRDMFKVVPRDRFKAGFAEHVTKEFLGAGMLSGFLGLSKNILADAGAPPKTWILAPSIIKDFEGYVGDVDVICIMPSNHEPSLSPVDEGKYNWGFSIALLDHEMRNKAKVQKVIDRTKEVFNNAFPAIKKNTLWEIWLCSDRGYGDFPPSGESRPAHTQPNMEGLFFGGDGYGPKVWGAGMDAAIHSALYCVNEMTGHQYAEEILPDYHR